MEFHIRIRGSAPDFDTINRALAGIDPLAVADIDSGSASLRVAAELSSPELLALLAQVGLPVDSPQLEQVEPTCCGACGG